MSESYDDLKKIHKCLIDWCCIKKYLCFIHMVYFLNEKRLFVLRFTRRCISVAPSRETAGELLLGKSLTVPHSCSMHNILNQLQGTESNVFSEALENIAQPSHTSVC